MNAKVQFLEAPDLLFAQPNLYSASKVDVLGLVADSIICTDRDGLILVFNRAAELSFGYTAAEAIGQPVELLLPNGHRLKHVAQVREYASKNEPEARLMGRRREIRGRRKNGEEFPAEAMISRQVIDGQTILTVVHRDITERKEMEEVREAVSREIAHRMGNLLAVVNSLILLSAGSAASVDEFKVSLIGRLRALEVSQKLIKFGEDQSTSLSELLRAELAQYQVPNGGNVVIEAPALPVGPRAAQVLALAIHELATNSAKYGALGCPGGRVAITSVLAGEGDASRLVITWQETGGPPVEPPTRSGFGTTLMKGIVARALKADVDLDYQPQGLVCRIALPTTILDIDVE